MTKRWWMAGALTLSVFSAQAAEDVRQLVEMPPEAQQLIRQEMRDNVFALNAIIGLLAEGKLEEAGQLAEREMGTSAMGRFRGNPAAPGRHMVPEMRNLGRGMHFAATEFADAAAVGELPDALAALKKLTEKCAACHAAYRIR